MLFDALADFFICVNSFITEIFPVDMSTCIIGCLTLMCGLAVWRIIS